MRDVSEVSNNNTEVKEPKRIDFTVKFGFEVFHK